MTPVTSFAVLEQIYSDDLIEQDISIMDFIEEIPLSSITALKNEIDNWNSEQLKDAHYVFSNWYNMSVPESLLKDVLKNNLHLALETYAEGIRDTCQRDLLIDALLSHLSLPSWPTYGDSDENKQNFIDSLTSIAPQFNIVFPLPA